LRRHDETPLVHWKKSPAAIFSIPRLRFRRQEAWFLPHALARSYALGILSDFHLGQVRSPLRSSLASAAWLMIDRRRRPRRHLGGRKSGATGRRCGDGPRAGARGGGAVGAASRALRQVEPRGLHALAASAAPAPVRDLRRPLALVHH